MNSAAIFHTVYSGCTAYFVQMYSYFMHTEMLHTMTSIYTVCSKKSESSRLHAIVNLYLYLFDVQNVLSACINHVKELWSVC